MKSMTMVTIAAGEDGSRANQSSYNALMPVPEHWALLPPEVATIGTKNFPYADIETTYVLKGDETYNLDPIIFGDRDGIDVVTSWIPKEPPAPPEPDPGDAAVSPRAMEEALCELELESNCRFAAIEAALCELDMKKGE